MTEGAFVVGERPATRPRKVPRTPGCAMVTVPLTQRRPEGTWTSDHALWNFASGADFWHESFQNWQSEFLAVLAIVMRSIWLRHRGSPESTPVAARTRYRIELTAELR